jgi:hypothetical protein
MYSCFSFCSCSSSHYYFFILLRFNSRFLSILLLLLVLVLLLVILLTKSNANPVTGLGGLWGCEMLSIPHCLDNRLTDGGEVVSPTHLPHFTPQKKKTKLHGLSPQANYTDRATAACRRSDCQLVQIEGARWSAWRIPPAVFFRFSRQEPLLFYQVAPQLYSRGWVDPLPDPLLFFSGSAWNRTRASGSVDKNSDH